MFVGSGSLLRRRALSVGRSRYRLSCSYPSRVDEQHKRKDSDQTK